MFPSCSAEDVRPLSVITQKVCFPGRPAGGADLGGGGRSAVHREDGSALSLASCLPFPAPGSRPLFHMPLRGVRASPAASSWKGAPRTVSRSKPLLFLCSLPEVFHCSNAKNVADAFSIRKQSKTVLPIVST